MKDLRRLAAAETLRVVGLMSGTSADGVDAAVVEVRRRHGQAKLLAFRTFRYPAALRRAILDACRPQTGRVDRICQLNFALGEAFAAAALGVLASAGLKAAEVDLIGSHGQTIHHLPGGRRLGRRVVRSTLQIGEPSVIAERTGIVTVADFRPRDVAAGGQGAPLVPYVDWWLLGHRRLARAVQNIGGIANVTYLPPGAAADDVLAFDTGPGNMVLDAVVARLTDGRRRYDRGGRLARRGHVDARLLAELMRHPYLRRRPPKSTGREDFGQAFAERLWRRAARRRLGPLDLLATVTAFTADSIADAYRRFLPAAPDEVILCGGGARNEALTERLRQRLPAAKLLASDALGLDADAKEAVAFAILAAETIRGVPNNLPSATGARRSVVLGKIVLG